MATTNGWGLIGTGRIADDRVLPAINAYEGNRLIGVVSRSQERANTFAKKFNAKHAYTSYDDLLKNPEVTVIAIHTPNSQHAEQAIAAERLRTRMILTVHDELLFESPKGEVDEAVRVVRERMEGAATLAVPLTVDVGIGENWKDAKP